MSTISNIFPEILGSKSSHENFDEIQKVKIRNTALFVSLLAIPIITTSVPILIATSLLLMALVLSTGAFPLNWKKIAIVSVSAALGGASVGILEGAAAGLRILGPVAAIASVYFDIFTDDSARKNAYKDYFSTLTSRTIISLTLAVYAAASFILKTQNFSQNETAYSLFNGSTTFFAGAALTSLAWTVHTAIFSIPRKK